MYYFQIKYVIRWLGVPCFILMLGCAQLQVKDGILSPPHKNYTVNIPGKGWEIIRVSKEDIALWHKRYHAMIAFISSNIENKALSLEMLNSQLFIGMKEKKVLRKESVIVDNQEAMHTILICEIDNHTLKVESYVIEFENQVYDLVYWAPPDSFDYVREDFKSIVKSFKFLNL
ncbi:MAG TPA: hypothetical protein ACFYEF_15070 [Candidatus Wunengus sp. YC63]|uniref:hypothetical protein n=1 Tax=Candidatus Wunengus sp. YC63 TaxID=3367699 RepID=UPI00402860D1